MKSKLKWFAGILMCTIMIISACSTGINKEKFRPTVKGADYNTVVEQGMHSEGLTLQDVLYEEEIGENKIVFITSRNALGFAYMCKEKDGWTWNRLNPYYDFKSDSTPPPPYTAGCAEIETPDGERYFLAMGKIFNPEIAKLTVSDNKVSAIIKEIYGNIYWFTLLSNRDLFGNIKAFDKDGKEINI